MKKRIIGVFMALILVFNLMACGSTETKEQENMKFSEAGEFPIVEEPVELTVWAILSPGEIEDYETNYQSEWYEEYTGVKINWINVPKQGWANSFQTSIMSGEYPDIYLYSFSTQEIEICAEYDAIIPLNDLIESYCPNVKKILEENPELKENITNEDGKIYSLFTETYNIYEVTQKLWVNADWLEQYSQATGNEMPETTEEFKNMLEYFHTHDMNQNGEQDEIPFLGKNGLDGCYNLFGSYIPSNSSNEGYGCYYNENGELDFAYDKDEFRDALRYVNDLYEAGYISDQTFTITNSDRYSYTSGKPEDIVVGVTTAVCVDEIVQLGGEGMIDYTDYVVIPPLEGPEGVRTIMSPAGKDVVELKNAITTSCEYPEIAAKWLDYWYSEEGRLWGVNGGIEGKDWWYENGESLNEDGKVLMHSEEAQTATNFCWTGQGVNYALTEEDVQHMDMKNLATNNQLATYLANLQYRPYVTDFRWPTNIWAGSDSQEAIEYSELVKLINSEVEKAYAEFIIGKRDIDDDAQWEAYIGALDDIGLERYIDIVEYYIELSKQE